MVLTREKARETLELILGQAKDLVGRAGLTTPQGYLSRTTLQRKDLPLRVGHGQVSTDREGKYWLAIIDRNPRRMEEERLRTYVFIYDVGCFISKSVSWPLQEGIVEMELLPIKEKNN